MPIGFMPPKQQGSALGFMPPKEKGFGERFMENLNPFSKNGYVNKAFLPAVDLASESIAKPIAKGGLTASAGPIVAAGKQAFTGSGIKDEINLPWVGNINPNANTPQQNVGLAVDFASGMANAVAPYKSIAGGFLRGGAQSAAKEALYNKDAKAGDIVKSGLIGGTISAALSPQAIDMFKSKAQSVGKDLYKKVLNSSDKQLKSGLDLAQEMQDRGLSGTTKSLNNQVKDIGKNALKERQNLLSTSSAMVDTDDVINEIDDFAAKQTPAPGTVKRFNDLKDRVISDIKAKGDRISLSDLTKLKSSLQSEAKSAFGTEGSQGKEFYKGVSNIVKKAAENADDTGKLGALNKDIRFSMTAEPKLDKVLEQAAKRRFISFSDAYTGGPAAALGSVTAGPVGGLIGGAAGIMGNQAINSNLVKTTIGKALTDLSKSGLKGDSRNIITQALLNYGRNKSLKK